VQKNPEVNKKMDSRQPIFNRSKFNPRPSTAAPQEPKQDQWYLDRLGKPLEIVTLSGRTYSGKLARVWKFVLLLDSTLISKAAIESARTQAEAQ
jgi:hypothetical protein